MGALLRELLAATASAPGGAGDTVTDIALACGFAHLGRLARADAARFGEPPSQTLARARPARTPVP